jgi:hypothetical protein
VSDSSVCAATRLRDWAVGVLFLARGRGLSLLPTVQTSSEAYQIPYNIQRESCSSDKREAGVHSGTQMKANVRHLNPQQTTASEDWENSDVSSKSVRLRCVLCSINRIANPNPVSRPVYPIFSLPYPLIRLFIYEYPPLFITPTHPSTFFFNFLRLAK